MSASEGVCLVCGHGGAQHAEVEGRCTGVEGMCQCHGYNPTEHPAQRLAAAREAAAAASPAAPTPA